jgi:excisionase family DNA binding protein
MPANSPGTGPQRPRGATGRPPRRTGDATVGEMTFLTVAEVAKLMRVSKMTVYRLVHSGTLPAVRVGRSFRVPENAVHDYLRKSFIEAG